VDQFVPCLTVHRDGSELTAITLGDPWLDDYLVFVAARARVNTWLAVASDLKVFFGVVGRPPAAVGPADVFRFLSAQRAPRRGEQVVRRGRRGGLGGSHDRAAVVERARPV
jgi:integrase/recombinase XerD